MDHSFDIGPLSGIDPALAPLIAEAVAGGSAFMARVPRHWEDGSNRFDLSGEVYLAVWRDGQIVAAGGLNRDPYARDPGCGRVRHVYVLQSMRRSGAPQRPSNRRSPTMPPASLMRWASLMARLMAA